MFRTKLISLLFTINVSIGVANGEQSVRLDAYSGVGSVLLVWSKTDDISAKGIHIYRSIDRRKSYQRLSEIDPGRTRYLDVNLIEGQTAFYHIEFVLDTGKSIKSDLGMEPFAQSLSFQKVGNYENLSKPVSGELNDVSLISNQIMIEFFKNEFPTENTSEFSVISSKLSGTEKLNQWFGLVRTKLLPNMETLGSEEKINALNVDDSLNLKIAGEEDKINHVQKEIQLIQESKEKRERLTDDSDKAPKLKELALELFNTQLTIRKTI